MPNSCPFKEEVLKEVEAGRQRKQEMKDKRRDEMKQRREEAKAQALEEKRTKVRALITRPGRINIILKSRILYAYVCFFLIRG